MNCLTLEPCIKSNTTLLAVMTFTVNYLNSLTSIGARKRSMNFCCCREKVGGEGSGGGAIFHRLLA